MDQISAISVDDLLQALRGVPDNVPPRGCGRRSEHTEPWVAKRLIASLATAELLSFPLTVELRDRPDMVVDSAGLDIGIELIELIPPAYAQAVAIANREFPSAIVDRSVFGWGTSWTPEAIREHLRSEGHRLSGDGWAGDGVEREWATAIRSAIQKKTDRLNCSGFRSFSENWLGTYASSPGPIFNGEVGSRMLSASDLRCPAFSRRFDLAVNLVSSYVVVISDSRVTTRPHVKV